jgi:hypothetical protein
MELTPEQTKAAETMSMDELRAAALQEAEAPVVPPAATTEPAKQPRGADGKFASTDVIDNSSDAPDDADTKDDEPTVTIYRKEIDNGNGSVDVYEAESLEELVEKLATGKLNANKKIQEFIAENRTRAAQEQRISADDEYVIGEKLKKNPKQTMKEVVAEVISEREAKIQRSLDAQNRFVSTHPDYIANPFNANKIAAEVQRIQGFNGEFTVESLEKAYQDLKRGGLLQLKPEGAGGVAEVKDGASQQTADTQSDATQQRSSRKGSSVSTRSGSRTPVVTDATPTEDEMYKLPLDEVRKRADAQLSKANASE